MHAVSFSYPENPNQDDKHRVFDFMHAFAKVLPCMRCRRDWMHYLTQHLSTRDSAHLNSREAFVRFLVDGHNYVNQRLSKRTYSYEEVRKLYEPKTEHVANYCLWMVVIVLVALLLVYRRPVSRGMQRLLGA